MARIQGARVTVGSLLLVACSSTSSPATPPGGGGDADGGALTDGATSPDGGPTPPPPPSADVTFSNGSLSVGGRTRTYLMAKPVDYDAAKTYPLVLAFHGQDGSAQSLQQFYPFEAASKREAFVVYPDGTGANWDLYTATAQNQDMPFIQALVDDLAGKVSIDKSRVLGTGYSAGAFFVNQMACRFAGFFKAIAPNAGGAPNEDAIGGTKDAQGFLQCPGGRVATFAFHGAVDPIVDVSSGKFEAYYWSHVNGCQDPGTNDNTPTTSIAPDPCRTYDGCAAGKPVTLCIFPNVEHVVAPAANAIAWSYFKALP